MKKQETKYRALKRLRLIEAMELCGGAHIVPPKKGEEMGAFHPLNPARYYDYFGWLYKKLKISEIARSVCIS